MGYIAQFANSLPQPLDESEQTELLNLYYTSKNEDVRQKLLEHNLRLCLKAAIDVCNLYGLQDVVDQAFSICYEELSNSLERFNPNLEHSFATYAIPNMKYQLMSFIEKESYRSFPILDTEIAIRENERHVEDTVDIFDHLQDEDESSIQEQVASSFFKEDIIKFINNSNWREKRRTIVKMYLGLECDKCYTRTEIAKTIGLSRQQVSQVITDSLVVLQEYIIKNYPDSRPSTKSQKTHTMTTFRNNEERNLYIFESYYGLNGKTQKKLEQISKEVCLNQSFVKEIAYRYKASYEQANNEKLSHTRRIDDCYYFDNLESIYNDYFGLNGSDVHSVNEIISKYNLGLSESSVSSIISNLLNEAIANNQLTAKDVKQLRLDREQRKKAQDFEKCKYVYCSFHGLEGYESKRKFILAKEMGVALSTIENWLGKYSKFLKENQSNTTEPKQKQI